MSCNSYLNINSAFAKHKQEVHSIIQEKLLDIDAKDFLFISEREQLHEEEFLLCTSSTINLFMNNRANGEYLLSSLYSVLVSELISTPLRCYGYKTFVFKELPLSDLVIKNHTYSIILLADNSDEVFYKNLKVVVPLVTCQYPWYDTASKRLNIKGLKYSKNIKDVFSRSGDALFLEQKDDFLYAFDFIEKYIYKAKSKYGFGVFNYRNNYIIKGRGDTLFYYGKASDYLMFHKEYIEKI